LLHDLKFTRSRSGNKNDGAHVEQKNWTAVRQLMGYPRYDTQSELLLLNKIWALQSLIGNHFYPQQKLVSKVRDGAKITKRYDTARTPSGSPPTPRSRPTPSGGWRKSTPRSTLPPSSGRSRCSATSSSPWLPPRANQPENPKSQPPPRGPFQMRQRSNVSGPLDIRQQGVVTAGESRRDIPALLGLDLWCEPHVSKRTQIGYESESRSPNDQRTPPKRSALGRRRSSHGDAPAHLCRLAPTRRCGHGVAVARGVRTHSLESSSCRDKMRTMTLAALRGWSVDREAPEPLWMQLCSALSSGISDGGFREDEALPSEAELINKFGVSRTVVRQALAQLVGDGLVYKIRAKGTFVAHQTPDLRFIGANTGSAGDLRASGKRVSTSILAQEEGTATPAEASALQLEDGARVVRLRRLRSVDGTPWLLVSTILPLALMPGLVTAKLEDRSLYEHIRRQYGIVPAGADRWLKAVLPTPDDAEKLGIDIHTPLLSIESIAWTADGIRFECYRALHRSEKSRFYVGIR
jgi:GntR family transcriptional regulator